MGQSLLVVAIEPSVLAGRVGRNKRIGSTCCANCPFSFYDFVTPPGSRRFTMTTELGWKLFGVL